MSSGGFRSTMTTRQARPRRAHWGAALCSGCAVAARAWSPAWSPFPCYPGLGAPYWTCRSGLSGYAGKAVASTHGRREAVAEVWRLPACYHGRSTGDGRASMGFAAGVGGGGMAVAGMHGVGRSGHPGRASLRTRQVAKGHGRCDKMDRVGGPTSLATPQHYSCTTASSVIARGACVHAVRCLLTQSPVRASESSFG